MSEKKFFVTVTYRDEYSGTPLRHTYETSDMGDAVSYAESVFKQGYLVLRVGARYSFVPMHRIIGAEVY